MAFPRNFVVFPYLSLFLGIPLLVFCCSHEFVSLLRSRLKTDAFHSVPLKGPGLFCKYTFPAIPSGVKSLFFHHSHHHAGPYAPHSKRSGIVVADRFQDGGQTACSTGGRYQGYLFLAPYYQEQKGSKAAFVDSCLLKYLYAYRRRDVSYVGPIFSLCSALAYSLCNRASTFCPRPLQRAVGDSLRAPRRYSLFTPLEQILQIPRDCSRRHRHTAETTRIPVTETDDPPVHSSFFIPYNGSPLAPFISVHEHQEASHRAGGPDEPTGFSGDPQAATDPEFSSPILAAPFPPTSAERFLLGKNLLVDSEKQVSGTAAMPGTGQRRPAEHVNGVAKEARFSGPLSFCDDREMPGPEINLAAPQDVYILDFDNVIHTNTRELVHTAIRAWRRLEKGASEQLRQDIRQHSGRNTESKGMYRTSKDEVQSDRNICDATTTTSSGSLPQLFLSPRFGGETPFWLRERAHDIRRSLALRGVADFMVAIRRVLEVVVETEKKRRKTVEEFVEERQRAFDALWRTMDDVEKVWLLTREGDMNAVRDVFAFRRAGGRFPWAVRSLQGWEKQGGARRAELYRQYGVTPQQLQEAFDSARREWQRDDLEGWEQHVKYRSDTRHLDPNDEERREAYEGFNPAAICLINNHINSWHRPVHVISSWETSDDLLRMLQLMGLNFDHDNAKRLLFLYGRDKMESVSPGQHSEQAGLKDSAVRKKVALVNSILDKWKPRSNFWRPAHMVDGDVRSLLAFSRDSGIARARLYFCEWGPSAIGDKVKAFLAGRIKYLKESSQLVKLMGTPADIPARQWTHGFTTCPPEWLEAYKMMSWLRWTDLQEKEETILQDFTMPPPAESPITSSITF
ncbi:hypothetical protein TGME49_258560 [Toxoplasma gondii ME49]|uniref:Transmembrane protein n=2 Tax=Toxoplasma gondii TaxID=5811 RepID=S8F763_TOXGM|nr:hypothetical protein TGME49_258560 [Toxoplasma gondii ME49]EPT29353.1 hypothetical protein TGME49_258560 [Toxoplasma gondii ME49]ESS32207.1 putative transmembrane protein [Toxoplasma gondii VEG]CEL74470.1 TPA: hypothetical protein BN1205_075910 [Toxoplasma gondii VEG]|eukprot:XP_018637018.1 hypothetical protein TGME49_258560 [Toxoplasma gondii ME49]